MLSYEQNGGLGPTRDVSTTVVRAIVIHADPCLQGRRVPVGRAAIAAVHRGAGPVHIAHGPRQSQNGEERSCAHVEPVAVAMQDP